MRTIPRPCGVAQPESKLLQVYGEQPRQSVGQLTALTLEEGHMNKGPKTSRHSDENNGQTIETRWLLDRPDGGVPRGKACDMEDPKRPLFCFTFSRSPGYSMQAGKHRTGGRLKDQQELRSPAMALGQEKRRGCLRCPTSNELDMWKAQALASSRDRPRGARRSIDE